MSDDRRILWNDICNIEVHLCNELLNLDIEEPPPWERLTRRQLLGLQGTMTDLVHRLHGYRVDQTGQADDAA